MLCPADVAPRISGASLTLQALLGRLQLGAFELREQRGQMELCSGEGSQAEGGSPVTEGVKGFHGPPKLGEGTWVLRGTTWRQGRAGRRAGLPAASSRPAGFQNESGPGR